MIQPDRAVEAGVVHVPDEADDATVVERSRHEPETFAMRFRRHAPKIKRYLARRIGPDAAEDVLAETFLIAFHRRDRYEGDRPDARPWPYGIAGNLVGRHRRSEVRQLKALARTGVDPVVDAFTERSDARIAADALKRQLAAALARLRAGHRDALLLVTWGN